MISEILTGALNRIMTLGGRPISLMYFNQITDGTYDDAFQLVQSGNTLWTSGVIFCVRPNFSEDNVLLEQGKIGINDLHIYTNGSLVYSTEIGSVIQTKVGIGSPTEHFYSIVQPGANAEEVQGVKIYKDAYIRRLTAGSLIGEV